MRKLDDIATSRSESTTPEDLNEVPESTAKTENENLEEPVKKKVLF